jgi:hypothetical protein
LSAFLARAIASSNMAFTSARQWQGCAADGGNCVDIQGETNIRYDLVVRDIGSTVRVVVTASNPEGSKSVPSEASGRVQAIPVVNVPQGIPASSGRRPRRRR